VTNTKPFGNRGRVTSLSRVDVVRQSLLPWGFGLVICYWLTRIGRYCLRGTRYQVLIYPLYLSSGKRLTCLGVGDEFNMTNAQISHKVTKRK
jgi:hypothetical protein